MNVRLAFAPFDATLVLFQLRTKGPVKAVTKEAIETYLAAAKPKAGEHYEILVCEGELANPTKVLARCRYLVREAVEAPVTVMRGNDPHNDYVFRVSLHELEPMVSFEEKPEPAIKWNVGLRRHEIWVGDQIEAYFEDKAEAEAVLRRLQEAA